MCDPRSKEQIRIHSLQEGKQNKTKQKNITNTGNNEDKDSEWKRKQ